MLLLTLKAIFKNQIMKTKALFLFTCLILLCAFKPLQNTDDDKQLYKVIIFKWVKSEKGEDQKKVIIINQDGSITINNKIIDKKINVKSFTKGINKFIIKENLVKEPANNDPPRMASIPKNGEQFISITIIKFKDFVNEKDFANISQYSFRKIKNSSDESITIYKYLPSDDIIFLKKYLTN